MHKISKPVKKKDHDIKFSGEAKYVDDYQSEEYLYAKMVRSEKPKAKIIEIQKPDLPEGCYYIDAKDAVTDNRTVVIFDDQPIFADGEVQYVGEAILMVVAPTQQLADQIAAQVKVSYEELDAIVDYEVANEIAHEYQFTKGHPDEAFEKAHRIIEETFHTGYQEQAYIEPQGLIAHYDDEVLTIQGSMQCPYYVQKAIKHAFDFGDERIRIMQNITGGGFGGKEDYPSLIACQLGTAAVKIKKPIKLIFKRREDITVTTKRHPSVIQYKTAVDESGNILAMDIHLRMNGGAYPGLSSVVLQRGLIGAAGVYNLENLRVYGAIMLSNTVPTGAFRGFGAPQTIYGIERHLAHIAKDFGYNELEYKEKYFVKQGDSTATGGLFREPVILEQMIEEMDRRSDYRNKVEAYKNQSGRYRKGIGMSIFLHGCGFTGSAEKDFIKSKAALYKDADGKIEVRVANTDIGQGLRTTFAKIVSEVLDKPLDDITTILPDTSIVPDSGPTVASRSLMVVGRLIEKASHRLKEEWREGEEQLIEVNFAEEALVIPWSLEEFHGDAYPSYSWGVNVVEVCVDTVTGMTELLKVWGGYDVGTPADELILRGQMEGGLLQGLGYGSIEKLETKNGNLLQKGFSNYMIPTALDTVKFDIWFEDNPYEFGPFGAKGAGEIPLNGGAPAFSAAVENAIDRKIWDIPTTPEVIMERMEAEDDQI